MESFSILIKSNLYFVLNTILPLMINDDHSYQDKVTIRAIYAIRETVVRALVLDENHKPITSFMAACCTAV